MKKCRRGSVTLRLVAALCLCLASCGYHAAGTANLLPTDIHTIAITPWTSFGIQYKLPNLMAEAVSRELISRTRYKIVADPKKADAVLSGGVAACFRTPQWPTLSRAAAPARRSPSPFR